MKNNLRRTVAILLALLMLLGLLLAAVPAVRGEESRLNARGEGYTAVLYDSSNGLPTSAANTVIQSAAGFIWIGGYSGLIRYDGKEFYRYDASTGISSVVCLYADDRDRIWIGTNDSGVAVLEGDTFTFYNREDGLKSSSIRSILQDEAGNILIATTMGLAFVGQDGKLRPIDDGQVNREYVCELEKGEDGTVYGVTLSGAFFTLRDLRITGYYGTEDTGLGLVNTVAAVPGQPGRVYLGTGDNQVLEVDLTSRLRVVRRLSTGSHTTVNCIRKYEDLLWICTDNGVGYFTADFTYVALQDLPMTNSVDRMMQDYEGNLWFTSSRQGVMKIVENRFVDLSDLAGLPPLVVNTTCRWGDDLYIGTDSGLFILDVNTYEVKEDPATRALAGARIRCIRQDRGGILWMCTYSDNALVRYDPAAGELTLFTEEQGMASNRVRTVRELSDGRIAVSTNRGINLIAEGKIVGTYGAAQGISNTEILCIEEAADGRLYLGSDGDGIYVVDGGKVSRLGLKDGLASEVILRIVKDPQEDTFWIVTSNSLAYMREDRITTVRSFPYSNNFDIYFGDGGDMWILASNGIYVTRREELLRDERIRYVLYDTSCGLPRVATANSFSHLEEDGTLYIAGSTGVTRVNIRQKAEGAGEVRLAVPFLTADDAYLPVGEDLTVRIPSDCRRLTIHPYAFTYSLNNPYVSYRLEGFDEEATEVSRQDMAPPTYTNLEGGTYRFLLSVIDTATGKAEQTLTVTIVKEMALHERTWFRVAAALLLLALVAGGIILYFRRKTAKLEKRHQENRRLINQMTAVFGSCIDMKDAYTNGHSQRVAAYTRMLAQKMGKTGEELENIYNVALLHDVGKISIPDSILNKPGRLTEEEYAVMKGHSAKGEEILEGVDIAPGLALGAGYHHERYDGRGYPHGLAGNSIPEYARIIAVADTFDAMYSTRPYRTRMPLEQAAAEIRKGAGTQFDPAVVDAFNALMAEGAFDSL